ncbi:hypothetical protein [Streptomyces sp. NPDC004330]|uniref:hypothetical protein n=1 Tax=Streptomyces sp. NPDC004330 TaxID=3364700 RepID=UPI0036AAC59C
MKVKYGVIAAAMLVAAGVAWAGAKGTTTTRNESATPSVTLTGKPMAQPAVPSPTVPIATRNLHRS